jgi:hypothetical protein
MWVLKKSASTCRSDSRTEFLLSLVLLVVALVVAGCVGVTSSGSHATTQPSALSITSSSIPSAKVQASYSATLAASGGTAPYAWSIVSGTLPAGLNLSSSSGQISGTPSQAGSSAFTVQVTDSSAPVQKATQQLNITVQGTGTVLQITSTSIPSGKVGGAYSTTLLAAGGVAPYTWAINSGSLPAGLTLNASTGQISGTPSQSGSYSFVAQVKDSSSPSQLATQPLSTSIASAATTLAIATQSLAGGQQGAAYSAGLTATGGVQPYAWSLSSGSLPAGLSLAAATGQISGTPTTAGTSSFVVQVKDSSSPAQTATESLSITITAASVLVQVTTTSLAGGQVGTAYSATLAATGGMMPYSWSVSSGSLPGGLTLSTTGTISGTPTTSGSFSFTVKVTDSSSPAKTATANLSITVAAAAAYSAVLSWTASTSSDVNGYNVYRSTTSGSGYVKINSSLVSEVTYTDSTVANGQTYYYVTTSVNSSNEESDYSDQQQAIIP